MQSALKLVPIIHPCKFGEIPLTGSRDIVRIRSGMPWPTGSALKPICSSSALVGMGDIKKKKTLQYIRNAN